eukprot:92999-Pyramimonas_sp.AAC.1
MRKRTRELEAQAGCSPVDATRPEQPVAPPGPPPSNPRRRAAPVWRTARGPRCQCCRRTCQ